MHTRTYVLGVLDDTKHLLGRQRPPAEAVVLGVLPRLAGQAACLADPSRHPVQSEPRRVKALPPGGWSPKRLRHFLSPTANPSLCLTQISTSAAEGSAA